MSKKYDCKEPKCEALVERSGEYCLDHTIFECEECDKEFAFTQMSKKEWVCIGCNPVKPTPEESLTRIAECVSYATEEDEDHEDYDENHCIDRDTLLGILGDVRCALYDAGIKIPTE